MKTRLAIGAFVVALCWVPLGSVLAVSKEYGCFKGDPRDNPASRLEAKLSVELCWRWIPPGLVACNCSKALKACQKKAPKACKKHGECVVADIEPVVRNAPGYVVICK